MLLTILVSRFDNGQHFLLFSDPEYPHLRLQTNRIFSVKESIRL
ncbi:MAG: hypothetical protein AAF316_02885 [Cyanobacteria bacterium P01_A01_bin.80]